MAHYSIISSQGQHPTIFTGTPRYVGAYLKPGYLEFPQIGSPTAIDWHVGDYVVYTRTGRTYRLYATPHTAEQATAQRYGAAFLYENVQFFDDTKQLERCPFSDLVPEDNLIHFSTQNNVSFFGKPANVAERIQACLEAQYGAGSWVVTVISGLNPSTDADLIEVLNTEVEFSVSGVNCLEVLDKVYTTWNNLGWSYSVVNNVNTITIGAPNKRTASNTTELYEYGNGLVRVQRSISNSDEIGTRLFAYGSLTNMPADYYRSQEIADAESVDIEHLMIPLSYWGTKDGLPDARQAYIQDATAIASLGLIPRYAYFDGSDSNYPDIHPSIEGLTIGDIYDAGTAEYTPNLSKWSRSQRIDEIVSATNPEDHGTSAEQGQKYAETITSHLAAVSASKQEGQIYQLIWQGTTTKRGLLTLSFGQNTQTFTMMSGWTDPVFQNMQLEIVCENTSKLIPLTMVNSSSTVWTITLPETVTIQDVAAGDVEVYVYGYVLRDYNDSYAGDRTYTFATDAATAVNGTVQYELVKTFVVRIPQIGFNINKYADLGNGKTISMKTGMCAARDFQIKSAAYVSSADAWDLTLYRSIDEDLNLMFPNADYQIQATDKYVLLDIAMPELYITAASQKLLQAAQQLLADICYEKPLYEPQIDAKVVYNESRVLLDGKWMHIAFNGVEDYAIIDSITIDENGSNIPTYDVVLRKKKGVDWTENIGQSSSSRSSKSVAGGDSMQGGGGGGTVSSVAGVSPINGDVPAAGLSSALNLGDAASYGIGSVASGSNGLVTGGAVWTAIDSLPEPMIFKGSLGTGGTITTLPTASASNEGYTYKVITAGTYAGQTAKVGDTFISNGSAWVLIPSGDEPEGTVTSVGLTVPTGLSVSGSPITTSGTFAISIATNYTIPLAADVTKGVTAYGYFDASGNAKSALKLTTVSKTAWGQKYWTDGGVPDTISGDMTLVGNVTPSANKSKNLGSSSALWAKVYSDKYYLTDTIYFYTETVNNVVCVHLNAPFITDGDQIVMSGTPGGGGTGGAGYLYELGDVYHDQAKTKVLRADGTDREAGDLLSYTTAHGWVALDPSTIAGTTYTAGTGISISNANVISVTANTYAPYNSAGYLPLSAGSTKALTGALYVSAGSVYNLYLNNTGSGATSSGIRFQIAGSTIGELYTRTSDNELCWAGGNNGAKVIYHTGNLTLSNGVITIGGNTITPVTDVTYDSTSDRIQVTKGGSASNVLVGFATTSKRFARYQGENVAGGYDLDTLLSGGGITSQYGSSTYWANKPTGMTYGGVVQLNTQASDSLCMQFAWDVVHTSSTVGDTGKLWWRDKPTAGWGTWHLIYDSVSLTKSVITGLLGNEYHPYGGGQTVALVASSLTAYSGVTAYNAAKTYRLNINFPTTGEALTVGRFYNVTEDGQTVGDLNIQSGLIYCVGASRVGINTSTPSSSYKLDVNGNVGVTGSLTTTGNVLISNSSAVERKYHITNSVGTVSFGQTAAGHAYIHNSAAYNISLYTNATERLRVDGTGNTTVMNKLYIGGTSGACLELVTPSGGTPYLKLNMALLTEGDQIVGSGTPGGGSGGGASYLYELQDFQASQSRATSSKPFLLYQSSGISGRDGNTGAWKYASASDIKTALSIAISDVSGLQTALDGKQATISDLSTIRTDAANGASAYTTLTTSQTKNKVLASPSNASGTPSFRALVAADIPDLSSTYQSKYGFTITGTSGVTYNLANFITSFTDENVKQTATTTSAAYEILFSATADNTTRTEGARKTSTLTYNPSTKALSTGGAVNGLTLTAATTGFTIAGGTTSKTLTVSNTYTLGDACAKAVTDSSSASAISTGTSLVTERDVYYGLPTINNAHNYTSSTTIYAPTSGGAANKVLVGNGTTSAPVWTSAALGADNKPIYLNSSGVLTEGVACLKETGGTISGTSNCNLNINNSGTGTSSYINFQVGNSNKASVGYDGSAGAFLQNRAVTNTPYVNIASDGVFKYKNTNVFYHDGNSNKSDVAWACSTLSSFNSVDFSTVTHNSTSATSWTKSGNSNFFISSGNNAFSIVQDSTSNARTTYLISGHSAVTYDNTFGNIVLQPWGGNVGIGTSSPNSKLSVGGDITPTVTASYCVGTSEYPFEYAYFHKALYFQRAGVYNSIVTSGRNSGLRFYTTADADDASAAVAFQIDGAKNARCYGSFVRDGYDIHSSTDARVYVWNAATSSASIVLRAYSGNYLQLGPGTYTTVPTIIYGQYIRFFTYNTSSAAVEAIRIIRSGYVGIGTTSPTQKLHVDGTILSTGDQVVSSDATLKTNWRELSYGVADIAKCTAGVFDWKDGRGTSIGTKAQDWSRLLPELVHGEEGAMTFAYGQAALVNTIIEAREIERLKARVEELENEVKRLRS